MSEKRRKYNPGDKVAYNGRKGTIYKEINDLGGSFYSRDNPMYSVQFDDGTVSMWYFGVELEDLSGKE